MKSSSGKAKAIKIQMGILLVVLALASMTIAVKAKSGGASTSPMPMAKPEEEGFSSERLQRVHEIMQRHIDAGEIAGVVTMISRNGRVIYFEAQGMEDIAAKRPMAKDAVFELASATKPITASMVLMLVEEGKVHFNDPVSKFIPEFKNEKVRILKQGVAIRHVTGPDPISKNNVRDYTSGEYDGNPPEDFDEVKASHDITVLDLLTHTSGLMSTWSGAPVNPKGSPQQEDLTNTILADLVPKFAAVPLDFQPGTKWAYSNWAGFDVLARIIEVASGQTYGEFLKQRLLEPLGMKDTWIGPLNDARADRLATRYQMTPKELVKYLPEKPFIRTKTYFSGGAGLSGTAEDYWRFCQMLLNGGEFNGKRILSPASVDLMRSNHVGDLFAKGNNSPGMGFGLGVSVVLDHVANNTYLPDGTFVWAGATGVKTSMSPKEDLILSYMVAGGGGRSSEDFETAAMQAMVH